MKIKNLLIATLGLMLTTQVFALNEEDVLNEMKNRLLQPESCPEEPSELFWKRIVVQAPDTAFKGPKTYRLRYSKFGCTLGEKGSIFISPGRSESSPEYYETAIDFVNAGFSPVYVIDHRGQGLSPRKLSNKYKGHVENFENYISDLAYAVHDIEKDLHQLGRDKKQTPFFYTSNSMGSAIGLGYFQKMGENTPFDAAALLSSMIKVNYLSFVDKEPTFFNNLIYSELGVIAQSKANCIPPKRCDRYARPEVFGDYRPGTREYIYRDSVKEMEKYMTHSKARYDLKTYIWDDFDWGQIQRDEYAGENWSGPQIGGATFRWTLETTKFLRKMRSKRSLKKMPDMPILLLTGTNDLRAYRPYRDGTTDLSRHTDFCEKLNEHNRYGKKMCEFLPLQGSFHEIYKESDRYRDSALDSVIGFFEKN